MTELDRVLRELARVQEELLALPDDAFAARHDLRQRQDQLRAEATRLRSDLPDTRPRREIEAELRALEKRLDGIRRQRIDLVSQAGAGSETGELGNLGGVAINRGIEEAQGAGEIRARMARLRARLEELDTD